MFKINNKGSSFSICICDFEQVNLCISNVTYTLAKYQLAQSFGI